MYTRLGTVVHEYEYCTLVHDKFSVELPYHELLALCEIFILYEIPSKIVRYLARYRVTCTILYSTTVEIDYFTIVSDSLLYLRISLTI
jgi:hypothetical protein